MVLASILGVLILPNLKLPIISNEKFECSSDQDCPTTSFCDKSTPGGMGPSGAVSGTPYGSMKCIQKCTSSRDCKSGSVCIDYSLSGGDIIIHKKGCAN